MSQEVEKSRFLSLVLRHKPEAAGIALDSSGWVEVDVLLAGMAAAGRPMTQPELERLVRDSDKQRFAFSPDGGKIRASQGHSLKVDLQLRAAPPPDRLYHGTVEKFLESIETQGLKPGKRHHVHLSADQETALKVGSRRGTAIILEVDAKAMLDAGHTFFISDNGVWLTAAVPSHHLRRL